MTGDHLKPDPKKACCNWQKAIDHYHRPKDHKLSSAKAWSDFEYEALNDPNFEQHTSEGSKMRGMPHKIRSAKMNDKIDHLAYMLDQHGSPQDPRHIEASRQNTEQNMRLAGEHLMNELRKEYLRREHEKMFGIP